jgi:hypothetical protein
MYIQEGIGFGVRRYILARVGLQWALESTPYPHTLFMIHFSISLICTKVAQMFFSLQNFRLNLVI